ncbi:MAG: hypothetical protein ACJ75B_13100 [Flavisolibacter sp.]
MDVAIQVAEKLQQQHILVQIEDTSSPIDPLIVGSSLDADVRIKLRRQDFKKAHEVLEDFYSKQVDLVAKDYYLFDFTDEELYEIMKKPDEWGYLDYKLAQKILNDRGQDIRDEKIEAMKAQRMIEISRPEEIGKEWIYIGYFISVIFSPLGIFYGSTITTLKKTLPNGRRVYSYNKSARKHGENMLIISSILTIIWILFALLSK